MVAQGLCEVRTREDVPDLFVECVLETDEDCVRVLTLSAHTNIARVDHAPFEPYVPPHGPQAAPGPYGNCASSPAGTGKARKQS